MRGAGEAVAGGGVGHESARKHWPEINGVIYRRRIVVRKAWQRTARGVGRRSDRGPRPASPVDSPPCCATRATPGDCIRTVDHRAAEATLACRALARHCRRPTSLHSAPSPRSLTVGRRNMRATAASMRHSAELMRVAGERVVRRAARPQARRRRGAPRIETQIPPSSLPERCPGRDHVAHF